MSYFHEPMSAVLCMSGVVCCASSTICFKDIFSETPRPRPRALIFGMKHCIVDVYQVCSNIGHGVQN